MPTCAHISAGIVATAKMHTTARTWRDGGLETSERSFFIFFLCEPINRDP